MRLRLCALAAAAAVAAVAVAAPSLPFLDAAYANGRASELSFLANASFGSNATVSKGVQ
jgi:hypothetical protein